MINLSDMQVASLMEEIAASMRSGIPLPDSMRRLQDRRLGRVCYAARQIAAELEQGHSIHDSLATTLPSNYRGAVAAVDAATRTGDPRLISSVARLLVRRANVKRDTRFAWFYPFVLLLVGTLVGMGVMVPIILGQHGRDIRWPEPVYRLAQEVASNFAVILAGIVALAFVGLILIAKRRRFSVPTRRALFCQGLADQVAHNVPEADAIRTAAEIAGESAIASRTELTFSDRDVAGIIAVPESSDLASEVGADDQTVLIAKLRYMASVYREQARRRNVFWSRVLPRIAMVVVGCTLIFSYAFWVIAPVYLEVGKW